LSNGGLEVFPVGSVEDFAEITMHLPIEVADFTGTLCRRTMTISCRSS
jgi:hypothetical protein